MTSVGVKMACGFKFCRGRGSCFLKDVSPCSAHELDAENDVRDGVFPVRRRTRTSRSGFVSKAVESADAGLAEMRN